MSHTLRKKNIYVKVNLVFWPGHIDFQHDFSVCASVNPCKEQSFFSALCPRPFYNARVIISLVHLDQKLGKHISERRTFFIFKVIVTIGKNEKKVFLCELN